MSIVVALGAGQHAQVMAGPERLRVRFGQVAGGGFQESSSQEFPFERHPEAKACWSGGGWVLPALQSFLQQIAPKSRAPNPALAALRLKLLRRLRGELRVSRKERDWRELIAVITALSALGAESALPELQALARDRHVAPGVKSAALSACLRLGAPPPESLLPAYLRALLP